jgi:HEPN domain-containing protein
MPPDLPEVGTPVDWLRYARSDLALASVQRPADVLLDPLCFHAQQAVEKSLKAVLLSKGIQFPYTHDIARLITLVSEAAVPWPEDLDQAAGLSEYAVGTRYPGSRESISEEDYRQALTIAEQVFAWAESLISSSTT